MNSREIFSRKAGYYNSRPTYADACITFLCEQMKLTESSIILDVGAGTGILSKQFLDLGYHVISLEPNDDMYAECMRNLSPYTKSTVKKSTAENMMVADRSVDAIVVGTAFHWFNPEEFRNECIRVLKNGGPVAIMRIFNNSEADKKMNEIHHYDKEDYNSAAAFFRINTMIEKVFEYSLKYDLQREINELLSSATAPLPGDDNYLPYIERIEASYKKQFNNLPYEKQFRVNLYLGAL